MNFKMIWNYWEELYAIYRGSSSKVATRFYRTKRVILKAGLSTTFYTM